MDLKVYDVRSCGVPFDMTAVRIFAVSRATGERILVGESSSFVATAEQARDGFDLVREEIRWTREAPKDRNAWYWTRLDGSDSDPAPRWFGGDSRWIDGHDDDQRQATAVTRPEVRRRNQRKRPAIEDLVATSRSAAQRRA